MKNEIIISKEYFCRNGRMSKIGSKAIKNANWLKTNIQALKKSRQRSIYASKRLFRMEICIKLKGKYKQNAQNLTKFK